MVSKESVATRFSTQKTMQTKHRLGKSCWGGAWPCRGRREEVPPRSKQYSSQLLRGRIIDLPLEYQTTERTEPYERNTHRVNISAAISVQHTTGLAHLWWRSAHFALTASYRSYGIAIWGGTTRENMTQMNCTEESNRSHHKLNPLKKYFFSFTLLGSSPWSSPVRRTNK